MSERLRIARLYIDGEIDRKEYVKRWNEADAMVDDVSPRRSDGGCSSLCDFPVVPLETDGVKR